MAVWNVIDHTELSGTATYWEETSIPSSYDHLCIVTSQRVDASVYEQSSDLTLNSDGVGYSYTYSLANSSSAPGGSRAASQGRILGPYSTGASALADTFATSTIWIPYYANTSNYPAVFIEMGLPNNSTTAWQWRMMQIAGLWGNTSAVNAVRIETSGGNFVQYSTFTLYGINGAA